MLKIRINNEEVVSNKDFTINEEMLNTSSVILNNVYPKTWEEDKDYVSRFYHPNDYSKCLISDETDVPEEPGTTVEDTSFSINVDTTKEYEFTSYKGQTTQSGTPTPTAPVPINVVSGRQDIVVCGNNLVDVSQAIIGKAWNTISNTARAIVYIPCQYNSKYTISFTTVSGTGIFVFGKVNLNDTTSPIGVVQIKTTTTITTDNTMKYLGIQFNRTAITQQDIENVKLMVNSGETATTYEAYKGNTYEINLGKNLAYMKNGTYTFQNNTGVISDNVLTLNSGSAGSNTYISLANGYVQQWAPTSNISGINDMNLTSNGGDYVASIYTNKTYSGTIQFYVFTSSGRNFVKRFDSTTNTILSFTLNDYEHVKDIGMWTNSTNVFEDYQIRVQLEKGSSASSYAEYKPPIELCKIGNYQDRIFKSSGKNLFDITTNTNGKVLASNGTITDDVKFTVSDYIKVLPNTKYTISWVYDSNQGNDTAMRVGYYQSDKTFISRPYNTTSPYTITTPNNCYYIRICYHIASHSQIQVELGNQVTSYEPYGTGWFIEKNIGKVVLNGTRSWQYISVAEGSLFRNANDIINNAIQNDNYAPYCNYYKGIPRATTRANNNIIANVGSNFHYLDIVDNRYTNATDFKNWQTTAKPSFYYVLATPTYTEITDSELIGQLEGIRLIEGLNNVGINTPYLPMIMNLHYNYVIPRTDVDILFCGVVKNSGNISLNPRDPHYQTLQILSYKTFLSEGETLDFVIYQKTIKEAIEQVVGVIADYGFVIGNINLTNGDEVIGAYSTKDKTAYDVFNYLADITQSRWTTRLIDENTVAIDFYDPTLLPLGTAIDYTNECFESHTIDNMSYSYGSNDYRNKQVMTSQEVYSNISQTQSVIANGYQTQFNVEQKIGKINSIKIGSTSYTIATNQEKEMGVSADFYYTPGNNYFESATTIAVGTSITVEYIPIVEGRQIISNSTEIDRIANSTGVKGVIARYENRNDAITSQELQKIGQSYIKYKGVPEIILTVQTRSNLWNIGDRVPFNAPIDELKTEYMVKAKKINYITTIDTIFYTYELTSSFNSENAINYFDNQRAKATGNIGSGEYISRNIDIQSDANIIFYDTTATEIEIVGDNTLEAVLEAPFVS